MKSCLDKEKTAENLRTLRMESGLTLNKILDALDLETTTPIYKWEAGVFMPSLDRLVKICELYGKTLDEIVAVKSIV